MNDAALVAVELRRAGDLAVRHPDELVLLVDVEADAAALFFREEEEAAVLECLRRVTAGNEHRRAEHLCVPRQPERDRRAVGRERVLTRGLRRRARRRL